MKTIPLWIIAVLIALLLIMQYRGSNTGPVISAPNQKTIDSLNVTEKTFNDHADTVRLKAAHDTVVAIRYVNASNESERRANLSAHRADSLAIVGDVWKEAYQARTDEASDLRVTVAQKDSAWRSERDGRIKYQGLYASDTLRRVALEKLNAGIVKDLQNAERPCRVVGPIPCPTRRESFIGGVLLGGAIVVKSRL